MIFSGTLIGTTAPEVRTDRAVPAVELSFRVDRAIAGVEAGQVLTIHEWSGAWSQLRPVRRGEHLLLFLYPPSHLGLTSPVGGAQGQIRLDSAGNGTTLTQLERAIRGARGK